nr:tRNA/rRNA methyltransferase [Tanacetum cinerariifolium]
EEALRLSDMHCSIPMKGMVDSFNVSVASGILMHHAVCDRTSRLLNISLAVLKNSCSFLLKFGKMPLHFAGTSDLKYQH